MMGLSHDTFYRYRDAVKEGEKARAHHLTNAHIRTGIDKTVYIARLFVGQTDGSLLRSRHPGVIEIPSLGKTVRTATRYTGGVDLLEISAEIGPFEQCL